MKISLIPKYFMNYEAGGVIYPTNISSKLGAYIHQEIFRQFKDITIEVNMMLDVSKYVEMFNEYLRQKNMSVLDVEKSVEISFMNLYFNGMLDMMVADNKGNLGVLELKTGNIIDAHKYQVALYAKALRDIFGLPIKFITILNITEDGFSEVVFFGEELDVLIKETERLINEHRRELLMFEIKNRYTSFED